MYPGRLLVSVLSTWSINCGSELRISASVIYKISWLECHLYRRHRSCAAS